jgi:hypothetical protein
LEAQTSDADKDLADAALQTATAESGVLIRRARCVQHAIQFQAARLVSNYLDKPRFVLPDAGDARGQALPAAGLLNALLADRRQLFLHELQK